MECKRRDKLKQCKKEVKLLQLLEVGRLIEKAMRNKTNHFLSHLLFFYHFLSHLFFFFVCDCSRQLTIGPAKMVHWHNLARTIVTLEGVVVQPVVRTTAIAREAVVPRRGADDCPQVEEQEMDRMVGQEQTNQAAGEVKQMLDRMHGKARPRTRVVALVVQVVNVSIKEPPRVQDCLARKCRVHHAMHEIEVQVRP